MTNQQDTAPLPVTEADAIRFCEEALRNVDYLRLSRDDLEDIRGALQSFVQKRFAEQAKPSASCEGEEVERVAQWLHDEGGFDEAWSTYTWPEHPDDTGQRDGGFVRIVPSDVQAKFRDVARRLLRGRTLAALSERGAVGEEVERLREALETIAQNDEFPLDDEGNRMPIRPQWSSHQCSSIARAALSSIRSGAGANSSGLADTPAEKG